MNRRGLLIKKHPYINMKKLRISRGRTGKISSYPGLTETILWNRCSYQVPAVVGTNASKNENHKFYNSIVQAI